MVREVKSKEKLVEVIEDSDPEFIALVVVEAEPKPVIGSVDDEDREYRANTTQYEYSTQDVD